MKTMLSPFRKQDGAEVVTIIKAMGGMEKVHLAFYTEEYEGPRPPTSSRGASGGSRGRASSGTSACCRTCILT